MDMLTPIIRGQCDVCRYSRNLFVTEIAGKTNCDHRDKGCNGKLEIVYRGSKAGMPKELNSVQCTCVAPALNLQVSTVGGTSWSIGADPKWVVSAAKFKIENSSGIPACEQRLLHETFVLRDGQMLEEIIQEGVDTLNLTLVRRNAEHAEWLELVRNTPAKLRDAPTSIREDAEIVMVAASQDDRLQFLAAPSLLDDAGYVCNAIQLRGGPDMKNLEPCSAWTNWIRSPSDAMLALRAASYEDLTSVVDEIMKLKLISTASEYERLHLATLPCTTALYAQQLLQGLPRIIVKQALQRSTLKGLSLGLELLRLNRAAPERGTLDHVGRGVKALFGASELELPPLPDEVLDPYAYAFALFATHEAHFQSAQGQDNFNALLQHLEGGHPPDIVTTCSLVRACLTFAQRDAAQRFFIAGGDDSDECIKLLFETRLPLTVLRSHRCKTELLRKVLERYGTSLEIATAISQNRNSLRDLLRVSEGDVQIGRRPEFIEALQLAVEQDIETAGRPLLRAFVATSPHTLPDMQVPLLWLQELRDVSGCDDIAIQRLLETYQAKGNDELGECIHATWTIVNWNSCTPAQLDGALAILNQLGMHGRKRFAEEGGRQGEEHRLELEAQLTEALQALPLIRLTDPAALCAPGLPQQAVALLAFQHARKAAEEAVTAQEMANRLQVQLDEVRSETQTKIKKLEQEVSSLRGEVRSLAGKAHSHG